MFNDIKRYRKTAGVGGLVGFDVGITKLGFISLEYDLGATGIVMRLLLKAQIFQIIFSLLQHELALELVISTIS